MNNKYGLFDGTPSIFGGLSNEHELVESCPDKFKHENAWSKCASKIFFFGCKLKDWKWKSKDKEEQKKQLSCFRGLISTFGIKHEHKEAVAGWMLSEMLTEVPEVEAKPEKFFK